MRGQKASLVSSGRRTKIFMSSAGRRCRAAQEFRAERQLRPARKGENSIQDLGHLRRKIENNAFGELTQHWHLTHCAHHHPVAVLALLWIKIIAFTLFHAFAILHGKLFRLGKVTLQELRKRIYRSLLCGWPMRCFSG